MIKIYDIDERTILAEPLITKEAVHEQEMMKSNFVRLSWTDTKCMTLPVGAHIKPYDDGVKYVLLDPYTPTAQKHAKFKYEPEFQHPIMWLGKMPFIHKQGDTSSWATTIKKFDWTYTGMPATMANEVCVYLNWLGRVYPAFGAAIGTRWTARVSGNLPPTITFTFNSVDIMSAAAEMANQCQCEYHFDFEQQIFYFGVVEYSRGSGGRLELKSGRNVGVPSVSQSKEAFYNCFVVKGGTRNISQQTPSGDNVQVTQRLSLDESKYPDSIIDIRKSSSEPMLVKELLFDDIYPKMELYLYNPRERVCYMLDEETGEKVIDENDPTGYKTYSKWYVRLAYKKDGVWHDYTIDPEKDLIKDKPLSLAFQPNYESKHFTSPLTGREFELVYFDKTTNEKEDDDVSPNGFTAQPGDYRIVFLEGDIIIPTSSRGGLYPRGFAYPSTENNIVTLFNVVVDEVYKQIARNELEDAGLKAIERLQTDLNTYTVPSNPVYFGKDMPTLHVGQAVVYDDGQDLNGGESYRLNTHIRKLVTRLDHPEIVEISVGNEQIKGSVSSLRDKVDSLSNGLIGGLTEEQFDNLLVVYGSQHFLSKEYNDAASGVITFLKGAHFGNYVKGERGANISAYGDAEFRRLVARLGAVVKDLIVGQFAEGVTDSGAHIDEFGNAEFEKIIARGMAKLQDLYVVNDSTFGGSLSSLEFISQFIGGKGWAIQKKTRINAAGVEEDYYTLEIDGITVRDTLRVYEMIVSQLRGEFDNYAFAAMMEVHHYDPNTGKVWLSTEGGRIKAVSFKKGDYIKVEQYQPGNDIVVGGDGYITKAYELIITDAGTGGMDDENGDRLDWVKFKNFTTGIEGGTPETVIKKMDTFVRQDNETDPERKGLMQIITVGPNTPYMDVIYGLKTDPNDYLKVRIGNLQGLRTDLFGWLQSYGAYLPNLYGVGKMYNRQTGESLNSSIEITRERLKSVYTETTYNISDEDNFLKNGFFARDMESWTKCDVSGGAAPSAPAQQAINSGDGTPLMVNGAILAYQNRLTAEVTEYLGMKVLHLLGMGVSQSFSDIKANGTHKENLTDNEQNPNYTVTADVADRLYMGIRILPVSSGTLKVSFLKSDGSSAGEWSHTLNASREWLLEQSSDTKQAPWSYTGKSGKMIVSYTGECYIRFIALMTDPIVNSRETYETLIEQTSRRITLQAAKQTADLNNAVAEIEIEFDHVRTTVTNNKSAADAAFAKLRTDLNTEIEEREDLEEYYYGTWVYQNDRLLSLMAAQFDAEGNIKGYADLKIQVNGISTTVTNNKSAADAAFRVLTSDLNTEVGKRQQLENTYKGTWVYQNDSLLSLMAAQFNSDGTIKGYAALTTKVDVIESTVTSNKTAADNAFANVNRQLGSLEDYIEDVDEEQEASATWIQQNKNKWSVVAASFNSDGSINSSGRVALYVNDKFSTFDVTADKINFRNVSFGWTVTNDDETIFHLDSYGNLTIAGKFHGEFDDTVVFGKGTRKMYIEPTQTGARLIGKDGNTEMLSLGFSYYNGDWVPRLNLSTPAPQGYNQDSVFWALTCEDVVQVVLESAGKTGAYKTLELVASARNGYSSLHSYAWPKKSDTTVYNSLSNGTLYVEDGFVKVKGW